MAKPQIQEVPLALLVACCEALDEGKKKYGPMSWRNSGESAGKLCGAIQRHIAAYYWGEETDPESATNKRHLAGAAASLAILLDCIASGCLRDDRPPPGVGAILLRDSEWTPTPRGN